ncbi:hypothetical protein B0A49_10865 [Cryomyces minteri]|uniref:Uncharacterized protein n=1 Tax=Cryomyces minteri TaxID=331657 RepID=A0A4U0X4A0_9PEZI|nr:hypothetical protein B0A49_10865 [Cryomyces minteri]
MEEVENLYHVVFKVSNLKHDPTAEIEKVRVCGTYTSLPLAKAAAHRCLFDAAYEQEFFETFDTQHGADIEWTHGDGIIVYAVAPDGEIFTVSLATTPNTYSYKSDADGKVNLDLYHVICTTVFYDRDASGSLRQTDVLGSYQSYDKARAAARTVLLSEEDGQTKNDWAQYDEIPADAKDWDYGEDVIVHAVGIGGENVLLSVVKGQEMESVRLMEAAMRIR